MTPDLGIVCIALRVYERAVFRQTRDVTCEKDSGGNRTAETRGDGSVKAPLGKYLYVKTMQQSIAP